MKIFLNVLFLTSILLGCAACADYPHNEASLKSDDIQKSNNPGSYGGLNNPSNTPNAPKANTAPATAPT